MPIAVAINIILGATVANALKLPIYLDSIGTILVGALAGPVAGALTGFLSNTLWTYVVPPPFQNGPAAAFAHRGGGHRRDGRPRRPRRAGCGRGRTADRRAGRRGRDRASPSSSAWRLRLHAASTASTVELLQLADSGNPIFMILGWLVG